MPDLPISEAGHAIVTPTTAAILRDAGEGAYSKLVADGNPPVALVRQLKALRGADLLTAPVKHADDAAAALAGLWLWIGDLDESHKIAQEIVSSTGSLWHAIVHRREGDFSNAKYWYRRCTGHHVNRLMGAIASSLAGDMASDRAVAHALSDGWNPDGFVDLVEAVHAKPADPRYEVAVKLQQAEWAGLFDYCIHAAVEADLTNLDGWDRRVNPM